VCSFLKGSGFKSNQDPEAAVGRIIKPIGLPRNFALVPCPEIENAVAIPPSNGIRYIVYDNAFMNPISGSSSDWAALSILAYEIGTTYQAIP
jgi:hypothetical protein